MEFLLLFLGKGAIALTAALRTLVTVDKQVEREKEEAKASSYLEGALSSQALADQLEKGCLPPDAVDWALEQQEEYLVKRLEAVRAARAEQPIEEMLADIDKELSEVPVL